MNNAIRFGVCGRILCFFFFIAARKGTIYCCYNNLFDKISVPIVYEEGEMDFKYDISTTVIDINCPYGENLDLPCKNIYSVMIPSYLSKKHTRIPEESTTLESRP